MAFAQSIVHQFVSGIADSGDATLLQPSNWNATHSIALSGVVSGGIPYGTSTTAQDYSALLAANSLVIGGGAGAAPFTSANLTFGPTAGQGLVLAAGTATTDVNALYLSQTWNNGAISFVGAINNYTFTAGANPCYLERWQIGGSDRFNMRVGTSSGNGIFRVASGTANRFCDIDGASIILKESSQTEVYIEAAGKVIAMGNGGALGFSSTAGATATLDTGMSRIAAGVIGVGTGAAASVAGTIRLTAVQDASANQVVGARGAAVADASGGAVVDAEARTALNALLARVRTHGLIST